MNKKIMAMVALSVIFIIMASGSFLSIASGQSQTTNTAGNSAATKKSIPVLLIHGYASDASL
ncbi:MAG: hypothetical protein ACJ71K_10195, partial [Nitrososphaeraceae archaeon]